MHIQEFLNTADVCLQSLGTLYTTMVAAAFYALDIDTPSVLYEQVTYVDAGTDWQSTQKRSGPFTCEAWRGFGQPLQC